MVIGKTTEMLSTYNEGDSIKDVTGPLGVPTEMADGPCAVIGGGVGLAIAFPVARHLVETGHEVHAIMGARTKDLLLLEDQFREILPDDHIHITTDDGSYGEKGVVTAPLERLLQEKAVSQVFCVGPVPMMKFSALTAEKYNTPITASLNPIMVDGTGMCGCCRVEVDGQTKFACVDGPDFDATKVDWNDLRARQAAYLTRRASPSRPMRRRTAHATGKRSLCSGHEVPAHAGQRGAGSRARVRLPSRRQGLHQGDGAGRGRALHGLQEAVLR